MSTQDDVLKAQILAEAELDPLEETSKEVDAETSEEVEEVTENVAEETEADETEAVEDSSLTPATQKIVDNFESLSEDEQLEKLENLEGSNRKDQLEAAQAIREIYGLEKPQPVVDQDLVDQAVEKKLQEIGITPESLEQAKANSVNIERDSYIKDWAGSNSASPDDVVRDKNFLKHYHSPEYKSLPLKERTELSLYKTYGNANQVIKLKKKATAEKGGSLPPNGSDTLPKTEEFNPFDRSTWNNPL